MRRELLRRCYIACCTSLCMFNFIGHGAIIRKPISQVVLPGQREVVFICAVTDFGIWFVNGTGLYDTNADAFQRRGITYNISEVQSANGKTATNLSLVVENRPENNATYIQCYSYGSDIETSPYAWMIVAGPPLAPSPVVQILNMTFIALVWDKPFTWTEVADIEYYTVLMFNDTSQVWTNWTHMRVGSATLHTHYLSTEGVAKQCKALTFMVSATNIVGSSKYGSVQNGGFPIQIKWPDESNNATGLSTNIEYKMTDGNVLVNCTVQSPTICSYQQATFNVIISHSTSGAIVVRENLQTYVLGYSITIPVSFKPPTIEVTKYNVIFLVSSFDTELQAVTSFTLSPSTIISVNNGEKYLYSALVAGITSGSLAVVIVIASVVTVCYSALRLKRSNENEKPNSEKKYEQAPPLPPRLEHLYDHIPDFQKRLSMKLYTLESDWQMSVGHVMAAPRLSVTTPKDNTIENQLEDYVDMSVVYTTQDDKKIRERSLGSCDNYDTICGSTTDFSGIAVLSTL